MNGLHVGGGLLPVEQMHLKAPGTENLLQRVGGAAAGSRCSPDGPAAFIVVPFAAGSVAPARPVQDCSCSASSWCSNRSSCAESSETKRDSTAARSGPCSSSERIWSAVCVASSSTGVYAYPRPARCRVSIPLSYSRERIVSTVVYARRPGSCSLTCAAVNARSAAHNAASTPASSCPAARRPFLRVARSSPPLMPPSSSPLRSPCRVTELIDRTRNLPVLVLDPVKDRCSPAPSVRSVCPGSRQYLLHDVEFRVPSPGRVASAPVRDIPSHWCGADRKSTRLNSSH